MCGRFAVDPMAVEVARQFRVIGADRMRTDADIRPTTEISTIVARGSDRVLHPMRWGFVPDWYAGPDDGPLLINARAETIATKPAFREACRARRCLIPASGFYEWQSLGAHGKRPHWLAPPDRATMFAGIWQDWRDGDTTRQSCAIVTCAASPDLAHIHHRLPVAVLPEGRELWLGQQGHGAATLMHAPPEGWWQITPDCGPPEPGPRLL